MCNVLSQQNVWKRPGTSTAKVRLCKMLQNCFMCELTGIHKAFGVQKAEGFSPTWMVVDRHLDRLVDRHLDRHLDRLLSECG